jgi:cell division protein ZapA (FtsZ GTPase activity inhibitor)
VKVSVAGTRLSVRTDAKPKYVKELAEYVTAKMEEAGASGRVITTQTLALLAAMTIADELFELRESQHELKRQVRERSERILRYLDREAAV